MTRYRWRWIFTLGALILIAGRSAPAAESAKPPPLLPWSAPPKTKPGITDGLDKNTLAALAETGTIEYFQPRPEPGQWNVVVGMMIHAPVETIWPIVSDYPGMCRLMPETFDSCRLVSKQGAVTVMDYKLHTSVLQFSLNMEITDRITEQAPTSWRLITTDGDLKGRENELLLVPIDAKHTLAFLRYYGALRSIGTLIRYTLSLIPDLETPVYASAAAYHLRSYKNAAEKKAGYVWTAPPALDYSRLDPATMEKLSKMFAGRIRETKEGKVIDAMAVAAMNAPPEKVWKVMTDFEHYDSFFPDSKTVVEKREGNQVLLRQSVKQFNVLVFSYGFDLHCRYKLEPITRMSYQTIDGSYKGSYGDFTLAPYAGGMKTLVYATIRSNLENDDSLTRKIVQSGAFPFDAVVNLFFARSVLNNFQAEVARRK